ncbi:MAG: UDP-glucose/GDP-mannose dehydrogenase family protein [Acidimicrobiia bacterium]|nr:UDP-glucose/GDP-mannose dehydrogenase family protein [Acidimicrobiia bacterium]
MKVSVFGAGYVGLVSATGLAAIGHQVVCIDVDAERVERLMLGEVPFYEPGLSELVTECVATGRLRFTTSSHDAIAHGEVLMIGVGTPPLLDGSADLSQVINVAQTIGGLLDHFAVVVVKSTVPVGTSDIVRQAVVDAARASGEAIDFAVASNPEFLKEGDAVRDFMQPDRIVIGSVIEVNDAQQNVLLDKAMQHFGSLKGKRCAIWGLSFKPETDDIRDAPALTLIRRLLAEGATVVAHDPLVKWLPMFSSIAPNLFEIVDCQYDAVVDADVLFLVTEWKQFRELDADRLVRDMRECLIVDGRNLWHDKDFGAMPVTYLGVGRSSSHSPAEFGEFGELGELRKLVS